MASHMDSPSRGQGTGKSQPLALPPKSWKQAVSDKLEHGFLCQFRGNLWKPMETLKISNVSIGLGNVSRHVSRHVSRNVSIGSKVSMKSQFFQNISKKCQGIGLGLLRSLRRQGIGIPEKGR